MTFSRAELFNELINQVIIKYSINQSEPRQSIIIRRGIKWGGILFWEMGRGYNNTSKFEQMVMV